MSRIGLKLQIDRLLKVEEKYDRLIMAVESKFPGETRHETALRYIKDRENSGFTIKMATDKDFSEVTLKNWPAGKVRNDEST